MHLNELNTRTKYVHRCQVCVSFGIKSHSKSVLELSIQIHIRLITESSY